MKPVNRGRLVRQVDFSEAVMHGMLAFLLLAGALQIDVKKLRSRAIGVAALATWGIVASAIIVAFGSWTIANAFGLPLPLTWAIVFGTLIAPTDPIAVLAALKSASPPQSLEIDMSGEALFNDGVAVVLFTVALIFARNAENPTAWHMGELLFLEAGGGIAFGLAR
ncbi:cation:proton antiporter domain-containing protein [Rhizobium binxianense]